MHTIFLMRPSKGHAALYPFFKLGLGFSCSNRCRTVIPLRIDVWETLIKHRLLCMAYSNRL